MFFHAIFLAFFLLFIPEFIISAWNIIFHWDFKIFPISRNYPKSVIIFVIIIVIITMLPSEESGSTSTKTYFNPPDWIIGSWRLYDENMNDMDLIEQFTDNNYLEVGTDGSYPMNHNEIMNSDSNEKLTEEISQNIYILNTSNKTNTSQMTFTKISETRFTLSLSTNNDALGHFEASSIGIKEIK